jgi:recombination protein RecT
MNMASASKALAQAVGSTTLTRDRTPYEKFRDRLDSMRGEIAALVGRGNVDRFCRVTCNAVQAKPELLNADGRSLFLACMEAAQDNLMPDGHEAVFNIFNTKVKTPEGERWISKVQYMPMVGGIVKKLYESGYVKMVDAVAVYERDTFEYERGDTPRLYHVPYAGDDDPGRITAAYVVIRMTNGEVKREVMFRRDIEKAHHASTNYKNSVRFKKDETGPWVEWPDQMAIKSVLHRVDKQMPSAPAIEHVLEADNKAMGFSRSVDINSIVENDFAPAACSSSRRRQRSSISSNRIARTFIQSSNARRLSA